jgi:hypothetical protein
MLRNLSPESESSAERDIALNGRSAANSGGTHYRTLVQMSDVEVILPSRGFFVGGASVYSVLPSILN